MSEQALRELSTQQAVLRDRMNTQQAVHESSMDKLRAEIAQRDASRDAGLASFGGALDKLRADLAKRDADRDVEMAKRDAETAKRDAEREKRDKNNFHLIIGILVSTVIVTNVVVGWLS